jgi:hypothetical protein
MVSLKFAVFLAGIYGGKLTRKFVFVVDNSETTIELGIPAEDLAHK